MGSRRIEAMVNALPIDSATVRAYDPEFAGRGWDTKTELLALIAEVVDQHQRLFYMANAKKGTPVPKPLHIPRPGESLRQKPSSVEAMQQMWASGVQVYKGDDSLDG